MLTTCLFVYLGITATITMGAMWLAFSAFYDVLGLLSDFHKWTLEDRDNRTIDDLPPYVEKEDQK